MRRTIRYTLLTLTLLLGPVGCVPDATNPSDPADASTGSETGPPDTSEGVDGTPGDPDAAPPDDTAGPGPDGGSPDGGSDLLTIDDYQRCSSNADCLVGRGNCIKSIPLSRTDADGNGSVPLSTVFPRLNENEGICTRTCTRSAGQCSGLSVNGLTDDSAPHVCQLVYAGQAPYPESPPDFPFDDTLDTTELANGQIFGAICRPPVQLDADIDPAHCQSCQMPTGCPSDGSRCWNLAADAPAEDGGLGRCLAACSADADCPQGFRCDATDPDGQSYCRPILDTCTKCRDLDGDGVGTGLCRETEDDSPAESTAYDCDDHNPVAYYNPNNTDHPFPKHCGRHDYNCNGLSDASEQTGDQNFPARHCTTCFDSCSGSVPNGRRQCQSVTDQGSFCLPECEDTDGDSKPDFADCDGKVSNGCETEIKNDDKIYYRDADGDGFGDPDDAKFACRSSQAPAGYVANSDDCKGGDDSTDVHAGAPEICDGRDNDCDGEVDEAEDLTKPGPDCQSTNPGACRPGTWTCDSTAGDWQCESDTKPGANDEVCGDGKDNDCDGETDERWDGSSAPPPSYTKYYRDCDGDGYGAASGAQTPATCPYADPSSPRVVDACSASKGYVANELDCDDQNSQRSPGRREHCSTSFDDDCDGQTNESSAIDTQLWYRDADRDGWGDEDTSPQWSCNPPKANFDATKGGDCDELTTHAGSVNPGATEVCESGGRMNQYDNDCSGSADDANSGRSTYYKDVDNDGYGISDSRSLCAPKTTYRATRKNDCADDDDQRHPNNTEMCNDVDSDCDGLPDDGCPRADNQYWRAYMSVDASSSTDPNSNIKPIGPSPNAGGYVTAKCRYDDWVWTSVSVRWDDDESPYEIKEIDIGCERLLQVQDSPPQGNPTNTNTFTIKTDQDPNMPVDEDFDESSDEGETFDGLGPGGVGDDRRETFSCNDGEAIYKVEVEHDTVMKTVKFYCRDYKLTGTKGDPKPDWTVTSSTSSAADGSIGGGGPYLNSESCDRGLVGVGVKTNGLGAYGTLRAVKLLCQKIDPTLINIR